MKTFEKIFKHNTTVLIVIHVVDLQQALRNAHLAKRAGADGIFLIDHQSGGDPTNLLDIYRGVRDVCGSNFWIGLNFLGLDPQESLDTVPRDADGLWVDNAQIYDPNLTKQVRENWDYKQNYFYGIYFGGTAFKGQRMPTSLSEVARIAGENMDVVTTSGPATGKSAEVEKIKTMREAIGPHVPLAIASGITPENILDYTPHANVFLVATGVSDTFTSLNEDKVRSLIQIARTTEN